MLPVFGTSQEYSGPLLFDSRSIRYKSPFGGISTRRTVHILFPVAAYLNSVSVVLFLRRNDHTTKYPLSRVDKTHGYVNYETEFTVERAGTYYYRFEIYHEDGGVSYVGNDGNGKAIIGEWLPEWQLSVYQNSYSTPDSFKGGVVYHIFCDRFFHAGEDKKPRYGVTKAWNEEVTIEDADGVFRANDFYGGDFMGIIEKLDYLYELGVTDIYLSPIFESSSNHRYDTGDYMKVDGLLGSEKDFEELIKKADEKGIGIILDGVFNHTGADSIYFNKFGHYDGVGAYQSKSSPYYDWYTFYDYPDDYNCWWGCTVVPTVARDAKDFHEFIAGEEGVIKKWTDKGVKGWRLDVVDELSETFVKEIRRRIKKCNPDVTVIGEVWEDASTKYSYGEEREYFRGEDLDGVMNYVFKKSILKFLTGGSGEDFASETMQIIENYPKQSLDTCLTLIDSHDTVRAINYLSGANGGETKKERLDYRLSPEEYEKGKKLLMLASALQFFLPGVPSVYYGDEIGMQGFEDPINRRPFDWNNIDGDILNHYRSLGKYRREHREKFVLPATVCGRGGKVIVKREGLTLYVDRDENKFLVAFQ